MPAISLTANVAKTVDGRRDKRLQNYDDRPSLTGVSDVTWSRPQYMTITRHGVTAARSQPRVSFDFCPPGVAVAHFRESLDYCARARIRRSAAGIRRNARKQ